jgi:hypothetical protein
VLGIGYLARFLFSALIDSTISIRPWKRAVAVRGIPHLAQARLDMGHNGFIYRVGDLNALQRAKHSHLL